MTTRRVVILGAGGHHFHDFNVVFRDDPEAETEVVAFPALGYSAAQLAELEATSQATPCDTVVTGTPVDLVGVVNPGHPVRRATYELREIRPPTLADVLRPLVAKWGHERCRP